MKRILKKVYIILMIIIMTVSYIPIGVIADEINNTANTESNENVKFDVVWTGNNTSTINANSNTTIGATIKLALSGVKTGFDNLKITVLSDITPRTTIDIKAKNKLSTYVDGASSTPTSLVFIKNMPSGIDYSGDVNIEFDRASDFSSYGKDVNFILTGSYINPTTGKAEELYIQKTINAKVTSVENVDAFKSTIEMKTLDVATTKNITGLGVGEYQTTGINLNAEVNIQGHNISYGEYNINISRTIIDSLKSSVNSETNLTIDTSKIPTYIKNSIIRNNDGTTDIKLIIGDKKETYTENDVVDVSAIFQIPMTFKIIEDTSHNAIINNTTVKMQYDATANGYTITKNANGTSYKEETDTYRNMTQENIGLYYYYGDYLAHTNLKATNITYDNWENLVKNNEIDLNFSTESLYWDRRAESEKENLKVYNYNEGKTSITYIDDDTLQGTSKELSNSEMKIKSINNVDVPSEVAKISFYKKGETTPFFVATQANRDYIVPDGEIITEYYTILDKMYGVNSNSYPSWTTTWQLDTNKLKQELSEKEINNITTIKRHQTGVFGNTDVTSEGDASISITKSSAQIKYSNFEIALGENFNTSQNLIGEQSNQSITLSMKKYVNEKTGTTANIKNINPKFYISLPDCFEYEDLKVELVDESGKLVISNQGCIDKNEEPYYINSNGYLVINCYGEYDSDTEGEIGIKITFKRYLNTDSAEETQKITGYMITDNEQYLNNFENVLNLSKNEKVPKYIDKVDSYFTIAKIKVLKITTAVKDKFNRYKVPGTNENAIGTYNVPIKFETGSQINYRTEIQSNNQKINNLNIIARLPLAGNKSIIGEKYDLKSTLNLVNLSNISIKIKKDENIQEISSENYTIKYSTDPEATFNSEFINYSDGDANIKNAKTIQVLFNSDYIINSGNTVYIYYQMEMPEAEGIVGEVTAVRYTEYGANNITELEPASIYVENGNSNGTLNIQKKFEGCAVGTAPVGIILSNIQFKLINLETNEVFVNDNTTAEGIIKTDTQGKICLKNIPVGKYKIEEVSEVAGFSKINYTTITIKNGETIDKILENPRKICTLNIQKLWEPSGKVQQGQATMMISRTFSYYGGDKLDYKKTVTVDPITGIATLQVPYGRYDIYEKSVQDGWSLATNTVQSININSETYTKEITNVLSKGNLRITKTVPEGNSDTVEGLSFRIQGESKAGSYIDSNGDTQYLKVDKTIVVGQEQDGVSYNISSDKKKVEITISNLYEGTYTVKEINMPQIDIGEAKTINRYEDVIKVVDVKGTSASSKELPVTDLEINNTWRTGTISINKTAEEGVELDKFEFRIYGTSYYGTQVDTTIKTDENGKAIANVLVGNYKVEEVNSDSFIPHYQVTKDGKTTETSDIQSYKVAENSQININIRNENAMGYVKVVKTLEGQDDVSKTKNVKFKIVGTALSGANIEQTITIGDDGTGISGPIPAGGEYELSEIEETTPAYYKSIDPMKVEITKNNTESDPLVLNLENKKGIGNLEISTQTNPDGGALYPIKYKIQQINLNEKTGEYERISGTEKNIDGNLQGFSKIMDIQAGAYIVEQTSVPTEWVKDIPQIVEVPTDGTGHASFIIENNKEFQNTKITISKQILNEDNNIATDEDFKKYKLNKNESFEVELTNIDTSEKYYVFIDAENAGTIKGIPEGTYKINEIYKPKYNTVSYNRIENKIDNKIEEKNGEYTFTIGQEPNNEIQLKIINKIDTSFGFGGQTEKDNYSKITTEQVEKMTRASLYIVDEKDNYLSNCTFELYNSENKKIVTITPNQKRVIIKGLAKGEYTIKNIKVPDGYLMPEDVKFVVYDDAVRVVRIEIQKNIPRGEMVLQTLYTTEQNTLKNVAKSKYKIVGTQKEPLTFIKNVDGSYSRSNIATATDTINIRAGKVTIKGIEEGSYSVGLVDVTDGYGLTDNPDVTNIGIEKDQVQNVDVKVETKKVIGIEAGDENTFIIDKDQNLWAFGENTDGSLGTGNKNYVNDPVQINAQETSLKGIKTTKVCSYYNSTAIIDNEGKLWVFGANYSGKFATGDEATVTMPVCVYNDTKNKIVDVAMGNNFMIAVDENGKIWFAGDLSCMGLPGVSGNIYKLQCVSQIGIHKLYNVKIKKVAAINYNIILLDEYGRIWTMGSSSSNRGCTLSGDERYDAVCVSEKPNNKIYDSFNNKKIKIIDIAKTCCGTDMGIVLDEEGKVYAWGGKYSQDAVCISTDSNICGNIANKKIVKIEKGSNNNYSLIDEEGKIYFCGDSDITSLGVKNALEVPTCINDIENSNIRDIRYSEVAMGRVHTVLLDKNGKLWSCGSNYYGETGRRQSTLSLENGTTINEFEIQVPNYAKYFSCNIKFQKIQTSYGTTIALDDEGRIWTWGYNYYNSTGNSNEEYVIAPKIVQFAENVKFKDIETNLNTCVAVDTKGRIWTWGYNSNGLCGIGIKDYYGYTKTCITQIKGTQLLDEYKKGITIEKVYAGYNCIIAIDSLGRIWRWGAIGNITQCSPVCMSEVDGLNEFYSKSLSIEKVSMNDGTEIKILDNQGNVWNLNTNKISEYMSPNINSILGNEMKNKGIKIIDISSNGNGAYVVDSLGRIWYTAPNQNDNCMTSNEDSNLFGKTVMNITKDYYAIDSDGHLWKNYYSNEAQCLEKDTKFIYCSNSDDSYFAIDSDGELWYWGQNDRYQLGNQNNINVNIPQNGMESYKNLIKGQKISSITNGTIITEDGDLYNYGSDVTYLGKCSKYLENQGITIVDEIKDEHYGYNNNASEILDSNGKIWRISGNNVICLSDIKDSKLNNAYLNENSRITKIKGEYALDNNGTLWAIGGTTYCKFGKGGTDLTEFTKVEFSENVAIEEIIANDVYHTLLKDKNGDYWICGDNSYGIIADGTTNNSINSFKKIVLNNTSKIKEIVYMDSYNMYVKDNNDIIWAWGYNKDYRVGDTSDVIIKKPYCWNIQVQDIQFAKYDTDKMTVVALDKNGTVWTTGYQQTGTSGREISQYVEKNTDGSISTYTNLGVGLGKVLNSENMGKISKISLSSDSIFAINENGELWAWGDNAFGNLGYATGITMVYSNPYYIFKSQATPVCLTKTLGNTFYQKTIKDIYKVGNTSKIAASEVIIQDTNNSIYIVGDAYKYYSAEYMYNTNSQSYPLPIQIDNIADISIKSEYIALKNTNNKIIIYNGATEKTLKDEITTSGIITSDLTAQQILEKLLDGCAIVGNKVYRYDTNGAITETTTINISNIKQISTYYGVEVIDKSGNLYCAGEGYILGVEHDNKTEFINMTEYDSIAKPIFNRPWNIIYGLR